MKQFLWPLTIYTELFEAALCRVVDDGHVAVVVQLLLRHHTVPSFAESTGCADLHKTWKFKYCTRTIKNYLYS